MAISIIEQRLKQYNPTTRDDEENALKEILQEIILHALSSANFFEKALFQGGTALRIFYGLQRFSEDLDFILKKPNPNFTWTPYEEKIISTCKQYNIHPELTDKSRINKNIKSAFLKDDSIGNIISLTVKNQPKLHLKIKLEIDVNPPRNSTSELKFLDFPVISPIELQDLSSNFAGKSHALLCGKYIKGRDWYDFLWYVSQEVTPNLDFLTDAINQQGPWENKNIKVTPEWYIDALENKIKSLHWQEVAKDVEKFLKPDEKASLKYWDVPLFSDRLYKLKKLF